LGLIINPRGTGGSGKTELARRIMTGYRWKEAGALEAIHRTGRERPIGYRLRHPHGGRPLFVLGHYERTSGGCDTIRAADGGLDEIFRLANTWASSGHDVLLEGSALSAEHMRSSVLAGRHRTHVLFLSTGVEQSARNLAVRRRLRRSDWTRITHAVQAQRQAIEVACREIEDVAEIEEMDFEHALGRALGLLRVQ
jgi:hypothetical protein